MQRPLHIALGFALATLAAASTALGVTGSAADGAGHPYVGALLADGPAGSAVRCSGVLIGPRMFATAGHCGADGERVSVSFDTDLDEPLDLLAGTLEVDPAKQADLAVVVLDEPAPVTPASLPQAGRAETLAKGTPLASVGYGYSSRAADGSFVFDGLRRVAESPLLRISKSYLVVSTRTAGPCYGDSGAPQLVRDTVISLTSAGSKDCTGQAEGFRLDTAASRAFLATFVTLP